MGSARRSSRQPATNRRAPSSCTRIEEGARSASQAERGAMVRALELAASPGVAPGPNPRVRCVGTKQVGEVVNLEVDVIAKYVEKLVAR